MQTKLLQKSLLKLFKKVTFTVRSVGSPTIATNLVRWKTREKPCLQRAIFELTLVPSAPKRPEKRAAVLLKNRTPVGPYVGAQQK